jgi:hypothetical protein
VGAIRGLEAIQHEQVRADIGLVTVQRASRIVSLLAAMLVLVAGAPSAAAAEHALPRAARAHAAIIGGQAAEPGTFPWMAYVLDMRGEAFGQCSGTVVAPNVVLTAAHCAENLQTGIPNDPAGYRVLTGNVDVSSPGATTQASGVSRVIVCGCFDRHTAVGDVALLELSTPTTAPAIALATKPSGSAVAIMAGWGNTYFAEAEAVTHLRWAPTLLQLASTCEREASPFSPASEICTVGSPASTSACNGDSGGPLLEPMPSAVGGMVQIGVVSHVYRRCDTSKPSVFTRVDAVSGWVERWVQVLASGSTLEPSQPVPSPSLAGIAYGRSLSISHHQVSLVIACGGGGGTCTGAVKALVKVRWVLSERRRGRRTVVVEDSRQVALADDSFAIAAGASATIRSAIPADDRELLIGLHKSHVSVLLSGHGIVRRVVEAPLRR